MPEARQRKQAAPATGEKHPYPSVAARVKAQDSAFSWVDSLRALVGFLIISSAVSYFVLRDSVTWGIERPSWTKPEIIKTWLKGPVEYTDAALRAYDGSDPDPNKPILLAINGSIYDVSAGRRHYGPGGSYHFFSGADASRAFVTQCFDVDINPDMRGVEDMYIPMDNPEVDALYQSGQLKKLKQLERKLAKIEVHKALKHWTDFFENSNKYPKIGTVKREPGWETKGPKPTLCKKAQEGRPKSRARPAGK